MPADHSLLLQLVTILIAAGAVYGGIRSDLKSMHEAIARIERAAEKAHERIDSINGHGRRHTD
jgi:hypothetical protein